MSERPHLTAREALDRFFDVIREKAAADPMFARAVVEALGAHVQFRGEEAMAVDPISEAAKNDYAQFREMFLTYSEPQLKVMLTDFSLASSEDIKAIRGRGPGKKAQFVELLWEGATRKLKERRP